MNHIYRVIFNKSTQTFQAVCEFARSQGKSSTTVGSTQAVKKEQNFASRAFILTTLAAAVLGSNAYAATVTAQGGNVTVGRNSVYVYLGNMENGRVIVGQTAEANNYSTAVGQEAKARAERAVAVGYNAQADSEYATAVGVNAYAAATESLATGHNAVAYGVGDIAIGRSSVTGTADMVSTKAAMDAAYQAMLNAQNAYNADPSNTALKDAADKAADDYYDAKDAYDAAVAAAQNGVNNDAIAMGTRSRALNTNAIAQGTDAEATGKNAIAQGTSSIASGEVSVAIGKSAQATEYGTIAIGEEAKATGDQKAIAIGGSSEATANKAVAIGDVAKATGERTLAMGSAAVASAFESTALGTTSIASGSQSTALGTKSVAAGIQSIAIGVEAKSNNFRSTAVGRSASATDNHASAFGSSATANGVAATAVGYFASAGAESALAVGRGANASAFESTALGRRATASAEQATALGKGATANLTGSVALGSASTTTAGTNVTQAEVNGITYSGFAGSLGTNANNVVSVGAAGSERQIQNVAAGEISETSTDAINGSQLYAVANNIPIQYTNKDGKPLTNVGDKFYLSSDIPANGDVSSLTPVSGDDVITSLITPTGATNNPTTLANVKSNLTPVTNLTKEQPNANQPTSFTAAQLNNAATLGDVLNAGWNLQGNGLPVDTIVHNDTVNFIDGNGTTVTVKTDDNKTTTVQYDIAVDGTTTQITYVDSKGNTVYKHTDGNYYTKPNGEGDKIDIVQNPVTPKVSAVAKQNYFHVNTGDANQIAGNAETNEGTIDAKGGATGKRSIAAGIATKVTGEESIAIGNDASVSTARSVAIGENATATYTSAGKPSNGASVAVGANSKAVEDATVVGSSAQGLGTWSTVVGRNSVATGGGAIAMGNGAKAGLTEGKGNQDPQGAYAGAIAIGTAAETSDVDAISMGSVAKASGAHAIAIGYKTEASGRRGTAVGDRASASGLDSSAYGSFAKATGAFSSAHGYMATASANSSSAYGVYSSASGDNSLASGLFAKATANNSAAIGYSAQANGLDSTAIGSVAQAKGSASSALGYSSFAYGKGSSALSASSGAYGDFSIAIGNKAEAGDESAYRAAWTASYTAEEAARTLYYINNAVNNKLTDEQRAEMERIAVAAGKEAFKKSLEEKPINGENAISIGVQSNVKANNSAAYGVNSIVRGDNSSATGNYNVIDATSAQVTGQSNAIGKTASNVGVFGDLNQIGGTAEYRDGTLMRKDYYDIDYDTFESTYIPTIDGLKDASGSRIVGNTNAVNSKNTFVLGNGVNTKEVIEKTLDEDTGEVLYETKLIKTLGDTVENSVYLGNDTTVTAGKGSVDANGKGTLFNALKDSTDAGTTTTGGATGTVDTAKVNNIIYSGFAGATSDGAVSVGASGSERRIQNVAAGEISSTSTDAINGSQLYIVADELSKRITNVVTGSTEEVKSGDKSVTVTPTTNAAGANVFDVSVNTDNTTITKDPTTGAIKVNTTDLTVNGGKVETPISPNSLVNAQTVTNAINNSGFNVAGNGTKTGELVNPGDTVDFVNGAGTTAVVEVKNGVNTVTYNVKTDNNTIKINANGELYADVDITDTNTVTTVSEGDHTTVTNNGTTDAPNYKVDVKTSDITANENGSVTSNGSNVATADQVANAINKSGFKLTTSASAGEVSGTTEELINPSETVTIDAGKNIKVTQSGNKVSVATKDDVEFNTVKATTVNATTVNATTVNATTVKAGDTTINNDGVKVGDKVSLTKNGLDNGGNRIINVAPGVNDTDAVNVSQLKQVNNNVNQLNKRINKVDRGLRAGIAGSNAAAALPQAYLPGKSMVAASAGTYRGESAVAVGYSRASDNGKVILKLQGNANTRGDLGAGVGVGYQW